MSLLYENFQPQDITEAMLDDAARLFNENYGAWGSGSKLRGKQARFLKFKPLTFCLGKRVTLTSKRLREQYLPEDGDCWYIRVTSKGTLVGNAFTCRWYYGEKSVCWVTQLVVHKNYRGRGIAGSLLRMSMADSDDVYGIMSSHPHACIAAASVFGST